MFQKYQKEVYLSMVFVSIAVVGGFIAYNIKREHGGVGHGNVEYGNVEHGNVEHGNVEHGNVEHVPVTTTSVRVAPIEEGDGAVRMLYSEEPRSGHGSAWPLGDEPLRMMSEFHEQSTPIFTRSLDPRPISSAHMHNVDNDGVVISEEEKRQRTAELEKQLRQIYEQKEMRQRNAAKKILRSYRKHKQRSLKQHNPSGGGTRKKRRTQRRKK